MKEFFFIFFFVLIAVGMFVISSMLDRSTMIRNKIITKVKKVCTLEQILLFIKKKWWYGILELTGSIYVYKNYTRIVKSTTLNAYTLIFIIWIILLLLPLFSEIEIGSIKLKKKIEEVQNETKESLNEIKMQIVEMKISNANNNSNTVYFGEGSLWAEKEIDKAQGNVKADQNSTANFEDIDVSNENLELFKMRLAFEKQIGRLCELMQYDGNKSLSHMVTYLINCEMIDRDNSGIIMQMIRIMNRGVHGEIISEKYIEFVNKMFPMVMNQLKLSENRCQINVCTRCGYRGLSMFSNVCPKCGYISDDE